MFCISVSGPDDVDDRASGGAWVAVDRDRVMSGRVEHLADVIAARVTETGQDAKREIPHAPDAFDDGVWIGLRVLERAVEVIHDRQPLGRDRSPGLRRSPFYLGGAALAEVIEVSERAQPQILGLADPGPKFGELRLCPGVASLLRVLGLTLPVRGP
jgi:hypothetical protein